MKQAIRLYMACGDTIDLFPSFTGRGLKEASVSADAQQNIAAQQVFRILDGNLNEFIVKGIELVPVL